MKTKPFKLLNKLVFFYGALFAIALTVTGLTRGLNKANFITTLLFLPVSLYFISQIFKKTSQRFKSKPVNLKSFFTQNHPSLFIALALFIFIVGLTIFRLFTYQSP